MAPVRLGRPPVAVTPAVAAAALDNHLPTVLRGRSLEDAGWSRPTPLTLLVPVEGARAEGGVDGYVVRLGFSHYPDWPPSAQFVNPLTSTYRYPDDLEHLPQIDGTNEISVHRQYANTGIQLICCSVTLEFYEVGHSVEDRHLWDPAVQTFAATINAIQMGLRQPYYRGRQAA